MVFFLDVGENALSDHQMPFLENSPKKHLDSGGHPMVFFLHVWGKALKSDPMFFLEIWTIFFKSPPPQSSYLMLFFSSV